VETTEAQAIRKLINDHLANAYVAHVEVERSDAQITLSIYTARPGIVIGRRGAKVASLRNDLEELLQQQVHLTILEIRHPELEPTLVARNIAEQLERHVPYRSTIERTTRMAMRGGAKGIEILVSGRFEGAEIARSEREVGGIMPEHTPGEAIDFGTAEAHTDDGTIDIKVWIMKDQALAEPYKTLSPLIPQAENEPE
jgi:small subunit ribosomal protein S3